MRDSKKERTYDFLWVWFLVFFDFHLNIKAAVTSIWVRQNTLINRDVNESKVRSTVVDHSQGGSRRCSSSRRSGDFCTRCIPGRHWWPSLYPSENVGKFSLVFGVVVVAVVTGAVLSVRINFSREVNLWIGSDTLAVGINPCSADMACVVVVYQRGVLIVVGSYVIKQRNLMD